MNGWKSYLVRFFSLLALSLQLATPLLAATGIDAESAARGPEVGRYIDPSEREEVLRKTDESLRRVSERFENQTARKIVDPIKFGPRWELSFPRGPNRLSFVASLMALDSARGSGRNFEESKSEEFRKRDEITTRGLRGFVVFTRVDADFANKVAAAFREHGFDTYIYIDRVDASPSDSTMALAEKFRSADAIWIIDSTAARENSSVYMEQRWALKIRASDKQSSEAKRSEAKRVLDLSKEEAIERASDPDDKTEAEIHLRAAADFLRSQLIGPWKAANDLVNRNRGPPHDAKKAEQIERLKRILENVDRLRQDNPDTPEQLANILEPLEEAYSDLWTSIKELEPVVNVPGD